MVNFAQATPSQGVPFVKWNWVGYDACFHDIYQI
jgi:hypothetical protein